MGKLINDKEIIKEVEAFKNYLKTRKLTYADSIVLLNLILEQNAHNAMHRCLDSEDKNHIINKLESNNPVKNTLTG